MNKAAKRKEQNRAAQKAFRERREQRVKDVSGSVHAGRMRERYLMVEPRTARG